MSQARPKLLILGDESGTFEELKSALAERFDVESRTGDSAGALERTDADVVLAGVASLKAAGRSLADSGAATLLNAISEGLCLAHADGRPEWVNQPFEGLPGAVRGQVAEVCRQAAAWFASGEAPRESAARACKFELSDEEADRYYEVYITPAGDADELGEGTGRVAAVVRDVTEARRTRQKMDAIDRAGYELVRLEADAVRKMNVVERLQLLETKIVKYTRDLLNFDHFAIWLIDERSGRMELVISAGLPTEIVDLDLYPEKEGSGISGYVAATGRSYVCNDASTDSRFLPGLSDAGSSLTVPLRLHDQVIGVMDIESSKPAAFSEEDQRFAEIFARHIAVALHMLDLLVVERSTTNQTISGRFEGELDEPLEDILSEAEMLIGQVDQSDPETVRHVQRIRSDVEAIRRRVRDVAAGPQTLLGVERALAERGTDPLLEGRRVLVADDELKIRRVIGDVLKNRGCEVQVVEDGGAAIEALKRTMRGEIPAFDLVLSDIKMPDRNGYEVFSSARKCSPEVPVILMTGFGYDPHHSIVRASQEGLQSVLFKPFQIERLLEEVRKAFDPERAANQ